jgi:quercetin dioxygenase-like cupin family protein
MKSAYKSVLLSASLMAILLPGAAAEDLSSKHIFDGAGTTRTTAGASEDIHLSVQSWGIKGDRRGDGVPQEIPLHGFYLAHLLSGEVTTTIGGETTRRSPGDYWAVKPGATMQVKALGDYAMLETTVISKQ